MKKFLAVLAVLALTVISSVAMADVTVSGSVDIRSLMTNNDTDFNSDLGDHRRDTQERIRLNFDAKNDNVKARVTIENDWEVFGTEGGSTLPAGSMEARQGQGRLAIREGWLDFTIPGAGPAHVKVGHQFLQLGNGWFFRSMKYGSDAWVVGLPGKNTIAFVDVKASEGASSRAQDDIDAYVLLDNYKIDDTKTVGIYLAHVKDSRGLLANSAWFGGAGAFKEATLDNLGLWFNGKLGPINLQAEIDLQSGKASAVAGTDTKFKGNQIVLQANMPMDALTINATAARGSGDDPASTSNDIKSIVTALDADPHYTFVYEYFAKTACSAGGTIGQAKNTGFCNTQALSVGASYNVTKNITVGLDYWMLTAVEKVAINAGATPSDKIGSEIDLKANFKLYDNLTWNWTLGRLMVGDAYGTNADDVDAVQGILSYKF